MPHQDDDNLRTPLQDLKSLLELLPADQLHDQPRHGNASINAMVVAVTAMVAFGWTKKDALTQRFQTARDAVGRLFPNKTIATIRQGLFSALGHCGAQLLKLIRAALIERLKQESCWLLAGRPTFAVDGSQFAVPRSLKNLSFFAAASRKSKGTYKPDADLKKASITQIAVSLCQHLGSGLPFAWNRGGSADSERSLLLNMLDCLPAGSRLVEVMVGRKRMCLLTNELDLTYQQLSKIYAARWGVEATFRMIKQNLERAKLESRTPKNVIIELDWKMLAIWYSLYTARACITPGEKLSGVRAFRVFVKLIIRVATHSVLRSNLRAELSGSVVADESGRKSEKNSKAYPRRKKKRQTGEPTINDLSDELWKKAAAMLA